MRSDAIDILVDLAGHTSGNRLHAFAHRPAPIQVTYLGYPQTTGLRTDRLSPVRRHPRPAWRAELVRGRGDSAPCRRRMLRAPEDAPEVTPLPARLKGHVTFGSLHKLAKLNDDVLDAWCRILHALPTARLLVVRNTLKGPMQGELRRRFAERGIAPERVVLESATPAVPGGYLRYYGDIDLVLDTFPWSGHTTTCEALWMGAPVVALRGGRQSGRMAASVLTAVELTELIAESTDQFEKMAVDLASDLDRLGRLRTTLRKRLRVSPLCDGKLFTHGLEEAYRSMWRAWCAQSRF